MKSYSQCPICGSRLPSSDQETIKKLHEEIEQLKMTKGKPPLEIGSDIYVIDRIEPQMYHKDKIIEFRVTEKAEYIVLKEAGTFHACKIDTLLFKNETDLIKVLNAQT